MSLLGGLDWIGRTAEVNRSLLGGMLTLLLVAVHAYEIGYKGFTRLRANGISWRSSSRLL